MTLLGRKSLILLFFSLLSIIPKLNCAPSFLINDCSNTTTFPTTPKYKANTKTLLASLSAVATANPAALFGSTATANGTTDAVYGLYLCRGDQNATSCIECVTNASISLPTTYCPGASQGVAWYDQCMVRYSNVSILGKLSTDPNEVFLNKKNYNGDVSQFKNTMKSTMNSMVNQTANNRTGIKFTTKMVNITGSTDTLYAMEQCTPDLSVSDCARCLNTAIGRLQIKQGSRVLQPSCHVRFEIYPFFVGAVNYSAASTSQPFVVPNHGKKKLSTKVIIAAIIVPIVAVLVILAVGICLYRKRAQKYGAPPFQSAEDFTSIESLQYELTTLQVATNNFSEENKLGEGGFGCVYKGTLSSGQEIAVKRLSKSSGQGVEEFKNEVLVVAKLQHRNLVRLLGFCVTGEEKLLVYEYIPNKSLDHFLFEPKKPGVLDWDRRYKIIGGIARGMLYLHQDSRLRIIHRDLKASNVLLDGDMNPKISDFGMAKIFGVEQTQGNTSRVVGTYGYMSPEYAMHGQFSIKSDVYSFGVLLLEIISGQKNSSFYESGYAEDLLSYAWKKWKDGTPLEFVDATIRDACPVSEVKKCMHLGLLCVQESIDDRPTMATAVLMLDSQTVSLPMPEQPAFFIRSMSGTKLENYTSSDQSLMTKSVPWSMNEASISELEPR